MVTHNQGPTTASVEQTQANSQLPAKEASARCASAFIAESGFPESPRARGVAYRSLFRPLSHPVTLIGVGGGDSMRASQEWAGRRGGRRKAKLKPKSSRCLRSRRDVTVVHSFASGCVLPWVFGDRVQLLCLAASCTSLPMAPAPGSVSTAPRLSPGLVFPLAPRSLSFWSGLLRIFARHSVSRGFSNPEDVTVWAARASAFSGRRSACLTSRLQPVRAFWPGLGTD